MKKKNKTKPKKRRRLEFSLKRSRGSFDPSTPGLLELDRFTDSSVAEWDAFAKQFDQYHYQWYFELEAQRATHHDELCEALASVKPKTVDLSGWGRAIQWQYTTQPLSVVGSTKWVGGRFNYGEDIDEHGRFPPFPALYLASDLETALKEMHGLPATSYCGLSRAELALCDEKSFSWIAVEGVVQNVFDLTSAAGLKAFTKLISGFTVSDQVHALQRKIRPDHPLRLITQSRELYESIMASNWREFPVQCNTPANSQVFGKLISDSGFDAILYNSIRTGENSLAVLTRNLAQSESEIRVTAPMPGGVSSTILNANTFREAELPR